MPKEDLQRLVSAQPSHRKIGKEVIIRWADPGLLGDAVLVGGGGEGGFGAFEEAGHGEDEIAGGAILVNVEVGELEARGILRLAVINDADGVLDQGEWPFFKAGAPGPDYESTWSGSLTRSGSTPISIAGAVAPYAGESLAYGYTISPHTDKWPVLYGDGHVIVATKPDWLNLDSPPDVWGSTGQQIKFWRYFDTLK